MPSPKPLDTSFLQIDEMRLHVECMRQPKLYMDWCEKLAVARLELDRCKSDIDVFDAELDASIRTAAEGSGTKMTEKGIEKAILVDRNRKKLVERQQIARYDVDILQGVVSALDQKKNSLKMMVDLHGQNYFSTVTPSTEAGRDKLHEDTKREVRSLGRRLRDPV